MFRHLFRGRVYRLAGILPFYDYRDPYDDSEREPLEPPETGWERVKFLFKYTPDGNVSKEYLYAVQLSGCTFMAAFLLGSCKASLSAFDRFLTVNEATKYVSAYEARRKLQDYVILEGIKYGLKYGIKCSVFMAITSLTSIIVAAYRGKDGILEYSVGAGVAGAVVRMYLGVMGTLVGSLVGASLGAFCGSIIWGIGKLSGTTVKDTQDMLYNMKVYRDERKSSLYEEAHRATYASNDLLNWLKRLKGKFEHNLVDEDMRYVVQPIPNDVELPSQKDENNNISKNAPSEDSVLNNSVEGISKEGKSNS